MFEIPFHELVLLTRMTLSSTDLVSREFFESVIDRHYQKMNNQQREHLFDVVTNLLHFDKNNLLNQIFYARFNPENQYQVTYWEGGEKTYKRTFMRDGKHYYNSIEFVDPDMVIVADRIIV